MVDTVNLALPLLDAAQAQKHVTMNEALARLDSLVFGAVSSVGLTSPAAALDGEMHIVGIGAADDWSGRDHQIALASNGGWAFFTPRPGWRVWSLTDGHDLQFNGQNWQANVAAAGTGGALTRNEVITHDHVLDAAGSSTTPDIIPDKAIVLGITARVVDPIAGAASWSLGVPDATNRYGSGFGTALNSVAEGVTGQPVTYYGGVPVQITSTGGAFTGGTIRIAVHLMTVGAPAAV